MDRDPKYPHEISQRLHSLNVLDRLTQINLARNDMEDSLREMLEYLLEVFKADRAWLLYPCNPDAPFWNVPMECTQPDWPGLFARDVDMPMDSHLSKIFSEILDANGPIQQGPNAGSPVPPPVVDYFSVKSQLLTAIRPKIGDCWAFGLHHCENEVIHNSDEVELFKAVAQRISDFLNIWISVKKLRESEELWQFALEGAGDGVWDWNPQTDEAHFSKRWKEMIGYAENEFPNTGSAWIQHLHPDDRDRVLSNLQGYFAGKRTYYSVEFRMPCKNGSWKWILARGKLLSRDSNGKPLQIIGTHNDSTRMIGTHSDISIRKHAEQQLQIAAIAFEVQQGIMITDADSVILRVNNAFTNITGYTAQELIGNNPRIFRSGRHDEDFYDAMWKELQFSGKWSGQIWNMRKNGEVFPEYLTISAVKDAEGIVTNYVASYADFTMDKAAGEQIKSLAFYDPLTQLPNRRLFLDRFNAALSSSERLGDFGATLLIDLDHFKELNDMYGHGFGDLLLQEVALRIKSCVREMDTVARFGGDEFVVLIEMLGKERDIATHKAAAAAEKVRECLTRHYFIKGGEHYCSPSIGISMFQGDKEKIDTLIEYADKAMYQAKNSGRNTVCFFDPKMSNSNFKL